MPLVAQVKSAKVRRRGSNMAREGYGTDPFGIISRGVSRGVSRGGASIGGTGMGTFGVRVPVGSGRFDIGIGSGAVGGSGLRAGSRISIPITQAKRRKDGGPVKEGKCDPQIAAFKNMIKAEAKAKPVKKACGGAAKVRKGMMKGK